MKDNTIRGNDARSSRKHRNSLQDSRFFIKKELSVENKVKIETIILYIFSEELKFSKKNDKKVH